MVFDVQCCTCRSVRKYLRCASLLTTSCGGSCSAGDTLSRRTFRDCKSAISMGTMAMGLSVRSRTVRADMRCEACVRARVSEQRHLSYRI